jgi:hypothetical protein
MTQRTVRNFGMATMAGGLLMACGCATPKPTPSAPVAGGATIRASVPSAAPDAATLTRIASEFRWNEFEQMLIVLGLAGDAERAFRDNMATRQKQFEARKASDRGAKIKEAEAALRAARDSADARKIAAAQKVYDDLRAADRREMEDLRRIVMGPLSADQRVYWAQFVLYRDLWLSRAAAPSDADGKRLWELCAPAAKELASWDYVAKEPYLTGDKTKALAVELREKAEKIAPAKKK